MLEMATVLVAYGILMMVAYEFTAMLRGREWGENAKSFFLRENEKIILLF